MAGSNALTSTEGSWDRIVACAAEALPGYLLHQRWYPAKDAGHPRVGVESVLPLAGAEVPIAWVIWRVEPPGRDPLRLCLPLALHGSDVAAEAEICLLPDGTGSVMDALSTDGFVTALVERMLIDPASPDEAVVRGLLLATAEFHGGRSAARAASALEASRPWAIRRLRVEQSNTSIRVGDAAMLKVLRRLQAGENPEIEIGRFLTERTSFRAIAPLVGWLEFGHTPVAMLQEFVPNAGDGWNWLLQRLGAAESGVAVPEAGQASDGGLAQSLRWVARLGERTAELHLALATPSDDAAFQPEPVTASDRAAWIHSTAALAQRVHDGLALSRARLDAETRRLADDFDRHFEGLAPALDRWLPGRMVLMKTRLHGDFHLGQVLVQGEDAVIIDFEGEPLRPLAERRAKQVPLRDVAGMLRSFDYAAAVAVSRSLVSWPEPERASAARRIDEWSRAASAAYLDAYFARAAGSPGCPRDRELVVRLVRAFALDKALYEVLYEFANRPDWLAVPLRGVIDLLRVMPETAAAGDD
jgi:trehalose synthase-fused probable maltokinase